MEYFLEGLKKKGDESVNRSSPRLSFFMDTKEIKKLMVTNSIQKLTDTQSGKIAQSLEVTRNKALLPLSNDPKSPYSAIEPATTGDYSQRIKNSLPPLTYQVSRPVKLGLVLVSAAFLAVFSTNAMVVYKKEQKVQDLLKIREELRKSIDSSSRL